MARNGNGISRIRRLHRVMGAVVAIFLIWMAVTGLLINHSNSLGLSGRYVAQPLLLDWYGLDGPQQVISYQAGEDWLSFAGAGLYFNGKAAFELAEGRGAVRTATMLVAAGGRELLLLDHQARLIERLPWEHGDTVAGIGIHDGSVVVRAGEQAWQADEQFLDWHSFDASTTPVRWSTPEPTPVEIHDKISQAYRGGGLSLQRVLLDAHSGRIFGNPGAWAYDLLALVTVFMAVSGLALLLRNGRRNRPNGRR